MAHWKKLAVWLSLIIVLAMWKVDVCAEGGFNLTEDELAKMTREICTVTGSNFVGIPELVYVNFETYELILTSDMELVPAEYRHGLLPIDACYHPFPFTKYSWVYNKLYSLSSGNLDVTNGDAELQCLLIIHELVHAQDVQLFNLGNLISNSSSKKESLLSVLSLIEGHVIQVMPAICKRVGISEDALKKYTDFMEKYDHHWQLYAKGADFINYMFQNTKLSMRDLFSNPPVYAQQIINPEKYLTGNFVPDQTLENRFSTYIDDLPWHFKTLDFISVDLFSIMIHSNDSKEASMWEQGYKNGIYIVQSYMTEEKPEKYVTFEEYMESIGSLDRLGSYMESEDSEDEEDDLVMDTYTETDTDTVADSDIDTDSDTDTEDEGTGTYTDSDTEYEGIELSAVDEGIDTFMDSNSDKDVNCDDNIYKDETLNLLNDDNMVKTIAIHIAEFDNEQNSVNCFQYINKAEQILLYPRSVTSPELKERFPELKLYFEKFDIAEDEEEVWSSLGMIIARLKSRYIVCIALMDIEPTEEEVFQLLAQIEKRL